MKKIKQQDRSLEQSNTPNKNQQKSIESLRLRLSEIIGYFPDKAICEILLNDLTTNHEEILDEPLIKRFNDIEYYFA